MAENGGSPELPTEEGGGKRPELKPQKMSCRGTRKSTLLQTGKTRGNAPGILWVGVASREEREKGTLEKIPIEKDANKITKNTTTDREKAKLPTRKEIKKTKKKRTFQKGNYLTAKKKNRDLAGIRQS